MSKKLKKILAMLIALCMLIPMGIAEDHGAEGTEPSGNDNVITTVDKLEDKATGDMLTVTTTTTTDENGKETVTVEWNNQDTEETEQTSGVDINGKETTETTSTTTEVEGSETRKWTEEDTGDEEGQPEVEVELKPGVPTMGTAESTEVTGDKPSGENDNAYDYTTTTTTDRTVTVETSDVEVTVNDANTGIVGDQQTELKGLDPVYDEDDGGVIDPNTGKQLDKVNGEHVGKEDVFARNYLSSKTLKNVTLENGIIIWVNKDGILTNVTIPEGEELPADFNYNIGDNVTTWYNKQNGKKETGIVINDIDNWYLKDEEGNFILDEEGNRILIHAPVEGAEFAYVGTGEHSKFFTACVTVTYKKDENGNTVIESIKKADGTPITINGVPATELPDGVSLKPIFDDYNGSRPVNFMLMDKDGNRVYAYCCDMDTGTTEGYWYSVSNLEDSDYYASEESEEHIRTIVTNGYWGTSDIRKEDGTYETGSLEKIKSDLKAAIINGDMENSLISVPVLDADGNAVLDENGNPVVETKSMFEIIDDMSEGEALLATQSAIWAYANGSIETQRGKDGVVLVDPDGYKWNHNPSVNSKDGEAVDDWGSARVDFLYNYLITLEPNEESTVVINEENNFDDLRLIVKDKVEGHAYNEDADEDNDAYNVDLTFKLASELLDQDDLLVNITYKEITTNEENENEEKLISITRRLITKNEAQLEAQSEEQDYESITPDDDGNFIIENLQFIENKVFDFEIRLEGTQYLEQGVYLYQPVGGRENSQTFVGIAEGDRNVDVSVGMTVNFDVDEDDKIVSEHKWYNASTNSVPN